MQIHIYTPILTPTHEQTVVWPCSSHTVYALLCALCCKWSWAYRHVFVCRKFPHWSNLLIHTSTQKTHFYSEPYVVPRHCTACVVFQVWAMYFSLTESTLSIKTFYSGCSPKKLTHFKYYKKTSMMEYSVIFVALKFWGCYRNFFFFFLVLARYCNKDLVYFLKSTVCAI